MGVIIGVVAAILTGFAAATGVTVAVYQSSAPDKSVNLETPQPPNPWAGAIDYGK